MPGDESHEPAHANDANEEVAWRRTGDRLSGAWHLLAVGVLACNRWVDRPVVKREHLLPRLSGARFRGVPVVAAPRQADRSTDGISLGRPGNPPGGRSASARRSLCLPRVPGRIVAGRWPDRCGAVRGREACSALGLALP